jgi:hypothetical protein
LVAQNVAVLPAQMFVLAGTMPQGGGVLIASVAQQVLVHPLLPVISTQ